MKIEHPFVRAVGEKCSSDAALCRISIIEISSQEKEFQLAFGWLVEWRWWWGYFWIREESFLVLCLYMGSTDVATHACAHTKHAYFRWLVRKPSYFFTLTLKRLSTNRSRIVFRRWCNYKEKCGCAILDSFSCHIINLTSFQRGWGGDDDVMRVRADWSKA